MKVILSILEKYSLVIDICISRQEWYVVFVDILMLLRSWSNYNVIRQALVRVSWWTLGMDFNVQEAPKFSCPHDPQPLMHHGCSWEPAHRCRSLSLQVGNSDFSWLFDLWAFMRYEYPWEPDRLLPSCSIWLGRFLSTTEQYIYSIWVLLCLSKEAKQYDKD